MLSTNTLWFLATQWWKLYAAKFFNVDTVSEKTETAILPHFKSLQGVIPANLCTICTSLNSRHGLIFFCSQQYGSTHSILHSGCGRKRYLVSQCITVILGYRTGTYFLLVFHYNWQDYLLLFPRCNDGHISRKSMFFCCFYQRESHLKSSLWVIPGN